MQIALIGTGAISTYVQDALAAQGKPPAALLVRPARLSEPSDIPRVTSVADLPAHITHLVDCAGHEALASHGPAALANGIDVITVSIGALANPDLLQDLQAAAEAGNARLHLASGALGGLDALQSARAGQLRSVTYTGRKPPKGWLGSPAEDRIDLTAPMDGPQTHFRGTAREAALQYPKNANVAAAVALAGLGFEATQVELIADPTVTTNIHEVRAEGDFGDFTFTISGHSLPASPRTSALAAMSVVATLARIAARIRS